MFIKFFFKLIDFGISGFFSGNIKETVKAGTTRFVPPEVILLFKT